MLVSIKAFAEALTTCILMTPPLFLKACSNLMSLESSSNTEDVLLVDSKFLSQAVGSAGFFAFAAVQSKLL